MITKPQGYDEAPAYTGEAMQLPAGCYVCKILGVKQEEDRGNDRFTVQFDIDEGEYKGFYQKQYGQAKQRDPNFKYKGVHRQNMAGPGLPFFKGLITSIEKSNKNFTFPFGQQGNEKTLVGKRFGAVMGREEFLTSDGKKRMATKIVWIRSIEGLKDAKVPEDKLLGENANPVSASSAPQYGPVDKDGFMNIPDGINEELPFM